ncbi:MAG: ATP-binding protein [Polyangia bacterium]|jgi:predicted AAA+ superfamily ATPase|nr:ATP-binding protein [Polyangia bacterium]
MMYIVRQAEETLRQLAGEFRAVAIVGPRQSGKTTLAKHVFPDKECISLEAPDYLEFASRDPRSFLTRIEGGAILDEVQRCPELLSYLQGLLDASPEKGRFILTGSHHLGLMEGISQSLAGRVGLITLLPLSLHELTGSTVQPETLDELLLCGGYPPVHAERVSHERWYNAYVATYLERDVRQLVSVRDSIVFQRFLRLCAASTGQLLNMARMGADLGIDQKTVKGWLSILEVSSIAFRLRPHHESFRKRLVKTPKLYFNDTGLAARLLGIENPEQLSMHPVRGALFETWVLSELRKSRFNRAKEDNLFFWRNNTGHEVDIVCDRAGMLLPIEVKSGATIASDWFEGLERWQSLAKDRSLRPHLVYGGNDRQTRRAAEVLPWSAIGDIASLT